MKRVIISLVIIGVLGAICIAANAFIATSTHRLISGLSEITKAAEDENYTHATEKIESVLADYHRYEPYYMLCIKSSPLEEIEEQLVSLSAFAENKDKEHLKAESIRVSSRIEHIWETEKPVWTNLL